jgi:HD-GYP domain-containing protein (c-di-GMP phosphodiesterase class II)
VTQAEPRGHDWADVVELLHALNNTVTVRSHYGEGHPAIARADNLAAGLFTRLFLRLPELVVALIDGEFVVSERPMPDLRDRIDVLADAMDRHGVECIVVQRGVTSAECTVMGRVLAEMNAAPGKAHEQARASLVHVGFRYAEKRRKEDVGRATQDTTDFVPAAHRVLGDVARAVAERTVADRAAVRAVASEIVASCERRSFVLQQRSHVDGVGDDAGHAVNVAMMTAAMALQAGLNAPAAIEATAAALLHDIGHVFMPPAIRGIPEPLLDDDGRRTFRHHAYAGASALLGAGCPPLWVAVALEHHRGVDGEGYPELESRAAPHPIVSLVALANFIDKKRTLLRGDVDDADAALARAIALQDVYFGRAAVQVYVRALGIFPPGTTVELSDRRAALVVAANAGDPRRPIVRVLCGAEDGKRVDLKQFDAAEGRHLSSIVRAIAPPLALRGVDAHDAAADTANVADVVAPAPTPAPPPVLPSLRPPGVSLPPAARLSGLYSSVPRADGPSVPPEDMRLTRRTPAPKVSLPPRITSTPPAAGAPDADALERAYVETLGSLDRVLRVAMAGANLAALSLDHRAGFVLSFVDGMSSVEDLLDVSGLPRLELLRILCELVRAGVVTGR